MTTPALVRAELGRLTATPLARLAFIALMIVPLLYGGMYLWANQDPYAKLDHIPAALVVQDTGATVDGKEVNYGEKVADQAVSDGAFDWSIVSASEARSGIRGGAYDFTFTIPADFSTALASAAGDDPHRARIVMTTDDTNSYLASTIAEQAGKTMRAAVTEQVGKRAAETLLVSLADIRSNLQSAADGSAQLVDGLGAAQSGASSLAAGTSQLSAGASQLASGTADLPAETQQLNAGAARVASGARSLSSGLGTLQTSTSSLPGDTQRLAAGAAQVADGDRQLADAADPLAAQLAGLTPQAAVDAVVSALPEGVTLTPDQQAALVATLQDSTFQQRIDGAKSQVATLDGQLDQLRDGSAQVAAGASSLATAAPQLTNGIASAASGASTLSSGAGQVAAGTATLAQAAPALSSGAASLASGAAAADSGATSLRSGLAQLDAGATKLDDGLQSGVRQIPSSTASSRADQASVISDPVHVANDDIADAGTYGAGLAPFFISLAAWIGMYALFLILKPISKRAITAVRSRPVLRAVPITLGAWLTPALLGVVQMLALFAIVKFALGFEVTHVAGTIAIMALASVTFAAIIMALNVLLGSVGQFLGLVLMLVQLVTAGGTFPWQTLPGPLAALHFALPMSYSVDAIRQLMYGGSIGAAWSDAGVLACWLLGALLVALLVAGRQSRSRTMRDLRPSLIG
ncbi:YhgE/Pip family protein [Curtobacterium sp. RRHDQ10]|uniref:YhgE/Pip family protein n=1 Tax=Curtobacterium phyllosphaerae TaxID=3413379 RepID=UPI003BF44C09